MHKSWGNAIEFDEAAERMGVDVMRWMFAKARPEDNILFGWHAADEARRELLVLWNVYAFFVTYARLAGWTPAGIDDADRRRSAPGARSLDPVARRRAGGRRSGTRLRGLRRGRRDARAVGATSTTCRPGTCAGRATGCARDDDAADRDAAFATLHAALVALSRMLAPDPAVPGRGRCTRTSSRRSMPSAPDSVHLTRWPTAELAGHRDPALEAAMASPRRRRPGPDAARAGRPQDPPAAGPGLARRARIAACDAGRRAAARCSPTRSTSRSSSRSPTAPTWSSAG